MIHKLSQRVEQKTKQATSASLGSLRHRSKHPLDGVNIQKLDEITLSQGSIDLVTNLLRDLNVMESATSMPEAKVEDNDAQIEEDAEEFDEHNNDIQSSIVHSSGYTEYEDDVEDDNDEVFHRQNDETDDDDEADDPTDNSFALRKTALYQHLTNKLSFTDSDATRACIGIQHWSAASDSTKTTNTEVVDSEQLGMAMDWLCLHLTDGELRQGFRPKAMHKSAGNTSTILLAGTGRTRPIPHESISIVKPLTSDHEWRETIQRESRKVGFVRLGFHNAEADQACDQTPFLSTKNPEDDEAALRVMLTLMDKDSVGDSETSTEEPTKADLDFAASEREQEVQALEAIYDDQFVTHSSMGQPGFEKYIVHITPVEDLHKPALSDDCKLHIFVRPGYPVLCAPLLLFTNSTLPPSLLRRINFRILQQANDCIGEPSIFSIVDVLCNCVSEMQLEFIKEQRSREMEVEQIRMRKAVGHLNVDDVIEAQYENDGKLGRRQRAKLRAVEKAFDHSENLLKQEEERKQKQRERLERVKEEEKSLRLTLAERTIQERKRKQILDDAESSARRAMNDAFNRGATAEEARTAASNAKRRVLREHGEPVSDNESSTEKEPIEEANEVAGDDDASTLHEGIEANGEEAESASRTTQATPTTVAFMERLRQFYKDAAATKVKQDKTVTNVSEKQGLRDDSESLSLALAEPREKVEEDTISKPISHIPAPIPIATGDLSNVMKDVVKTQQEQPWLVSPEARVPRNVSDNDSLSESQLRERQRSSARLKDELSSKWEAAEAWGRKSSGVASTSNRLPPAGRFHKMLVQRQRYVLVVEL